MTYLENSRRTFVAAGPISTDALVSLTDAGVVESDGLGALGVCETGATTAGEHVSVRLLNTAGTVEVNIAGAASVGALLSAGPAGTVEATPSGLVVGVAVSGTSGGVVEMMPFPPSVPMSSLLAPYAASADLPAARLVTLGADGVSLCGATGTPVGVASRAAKAGEQAQIAYFGHGPARVTASEAVAAGDKLTTADDGKVAKHPGSGGKTVLGTALTAASGDGAAFDMLPLAFPSL